MLLFTIMEMMRMTFLVVVNDNDGAAVAENGDY